jgi:hypothetical protein
MLGGFLKAAADKDVRELERVKQVACSTSGEDQMESVAFLKQLGDE